MTRPPCVRLCLAYPGNPRTRIEGESPPQEKGHTVFGGLRPPCNDAELHPILLHRLRVPCKPIPGPLGHDRKTILDAQRLLDDRIRPVDPFEPVARGGRGEKMRTHLGKEMRRHLDTMRRSETCRALP